MVRSMALRLPTILVFGSPFGPPTVREALPTVTVAILTDQPINLGTDISLGSG